MTTASDAGGVEDARPELVTPPGGVRTTRRRGRTSSAKVEALATLGPRWSVPATGPWTAAALSERFGRSGPIFLDIGPGNGVATRAWAAERPDALVIAIELHRPGIARLLTDLEDDGPPNVRVAEADAVAVVDAVDAGSIAEVRVLFPDPWPKRRHVTRRLVDRAFVGAVGDALAPGGHLHLATDWADYAEHMRTMVATDRRFEPRPGERPPRPVTAYERRGIDLGRAITDLVYERVDPTAR